MTTQPPDPNEPRRRRPYVKPQVTAVPLRPQEAVLGHCKIASGAGPGGSDCILCYDHGS